MTSLPAPVRPGVVASEVLPPMPARDATLATDFAGRRGKLFGLALGTAILTVLTLGLYRFWMKTRLRRWYWSAIRPGGLPLEYTGQPLEKLLGFLIAVVVLAFYIGLVNLVLMFASFALFQSNVAAYVLSFLGIVPVIFYARYRARRYVLARTRWRGIRFTLDPGAWGYAGRALVHWTAVVATLGLWWPRMTFALEKYRTDRTRFGTERLHQGGAPTMLYPAFVHVLIGVVFTVLAATVAIIDDAPRFFWLTAIFGPWALIGLVFWQVDSTRRLANARTAGPLGLVARPRTSRVAGIYLLGGGLIVICLALVLALLVTPLFIANADPLANVPAAVLADPRVALALLVINITFFLAFDVLRHVFLTFPLWRHYAETLTVTGGDGLNAIRQSARDDFTEAEGFAEALDLGGAI